MKKLVKWAAIGVVALLALLAIIVAIMIVMSKGRLNHAFKVEGEDVVVPTDADSITEGQRLFGARGCAECHSADGTGRVIVDAPPFRFEAANITLVAKSWSTKDFERAIRHGVSPAGKAYVLMPGWEYHPMPDAELGKIIAYVRTLEPKGEVRAPSEIRTIGHILHTLRAGELIQAEDVVGKQHVPATLGTPAYGEYLSRSCTGCHGRTFSGGPIPGAPESELGLPANITPTGIGTWTEADFATLLRTGRRPNGTSVNPKFMPIGAFKHFTEVEVHDLYSYLHSIPGKPTGQR